MISVTDSSKDFSFEQIHFSSSDIKAGSHYSQKYMFDTSLTHRPLSYIPEYIINVY